MGVAETHQMWMANCQPSARLPLQQFDGGGILLPFGPESFDGAEFIGAKFPSGIDARERAAAEGLHEFITRDYGQRLHSLSADGNWKNGATWQKAPRCYYR